ncbi:MAG: hypothetical protein II740_01440 [Lachnospiraceae bacterium]|nr:hypothetical protein [Lachnospiraceae bacterium]
MERYKKLLEQAGIKNWFIKNKIDSSVELFFIKKNLDMRRIKEVDNAEIAVFTDVEKDGEKKRGRADIRVNSSMTDREILTKIKEAEYAASFATNKFFEFPKPTKSELKVQDSDLNGLELSEIATKFADAAYSVDNDKDAFINSFELFVEESTVRMMSATGTDVAYKTRVVKGEFVTQCRKPQDVETYLDYEFDTLALDDMKDLVETSLKTSKDRARANAMPKSGKTDVIISGRYMEELMSFYADRANVSFIYPGYSNYKVGDNVQGEDVKGDKVNIKFLPLQPFNNEGIEMKEREFIKDGELKLVHGNQRISYYMGVEPIGTYEKVQIPAGKVSLKEMTDRPCLHVVNFSDFQMDALDGHFASEIRLAYYYDGKGNVTPVTGGSINGSIFDCQNDLTFSKEVQKLSKYVGPKACLFKNVMVSGE